MADDVIRNPDLLDEWMAVFAPDAIVQIGPEPVHGHAAVVEFYRQWITGFTESKHFWTSTVLDDQTLRAQWVAAGTMADGSLMAVGGVEHAKVDAEGRITNLRNEFTIPPA
jgi:hypothetical protein